MQTSLAVQNTLRDNTTELCNTASSAGREGRPEAWLCPAFPHKPPFPPGTQLLAIKLFDRLVGQPGLFTVTQLQDLYGRPHRILCRPFHLHLAVLGPGFPPHMVISSNKLLLRSRAWDSSQPCCPPKKQPCPATGSHSRALGEDNRAAFY